jgi:hypothetical protein
MLHKDLVVLVVAFRIWATSVAQLTNIQKILIF